MLTPTTDTERLEKFKFKLALVNTVTDKLFIALIVAVVAYFLNRSIESYKSDLQAQLQAQRVSHERSLKQLELANSRAIADANAAQHAKLEELRGEQAAQLEKVRAALAVQGTVSQRTLDAHETVYAACLDFGNELDRLGREADGPQVAKLRRESILRFMDAYQKRRLYLSDATMKAFDNLIGRMEPTKIEQGDAGWISVFYMNASGPLAQLRKDLKSEIARQKAALR